MGPEKYTKLPVEIEAFHFYSPDNINLFDVGFKIFTWSEGKVYYIPSGVDNPHRYPDERESMSYESCGDVYDDAPPFLLVHTIEGVMRANPGDFIIRGVQGEYYPCAANIFASTYKKVKD